MSRCRCSSRAGIDDLQSSPAKGRGAAERGGGGGPPKLSGFRSLRPAEAGHLPLAGEDFPYRLAVTCGCSTATTGSSTELAVAPPRSTVTVAFR